MSFRLGILGGGLQGLEAAAVARLSGWETVLMDGRPGAPAAGIASRFVARTARTAADLDLAFGSCDAVLPANENLATLELVDAWARTPCAPPVAFDLASFRISRDKLESKRLFAASGAPAPLPYPASGFPIIAKPGDRSGSRGVRLVSSREELDALFPAGVPAGHVLEEYCPGPSYSLEATGRPGGHRAWTVTGLLMDGSFDCRGVRSPARLDPSLEAAFRRMTLDVAGNLSLKGLMDIEVMSTPRGLRALEIDARFPSQTPLAVLLSSGENLLYRLLSIFGPVPEPSRGAPRHALLEHLDVSGGRMSLTGERRMALAGPLDLKEGFHGADLALTDASPGRTSWAATLMLQAGSEEGLLLKRADMYARLSAHLGAPPPPESLEGAFP
ncbi:MAG: 3-methylornithine--L-lysine ligase PylC [Deltaproteobacteria bacterium]|nr:3-methylornithine--L-lysine ligase PylC [Deltaproteobacteria bacterium]